MKSKYWIVIFAVILLVCAAASYVLMGGEPASRAEISSNGEVIRIVDLNIAQEFTISTDTGFNTITVQDGKIAVSDADCPDHYCIDRGYCNSGTQIVCLPNRLVIRFLDEEVIDMVVG